jgi:hypothetical protein
MRYSKYALIALCVVLAMVITTELYKSYSVDFDGYDHFVMEIGEDDEELEVRLEKMAYMMEQNGLDYFIVNEIVQDSSRVHIELYCSSDEVKQKLCRDDRREAGTYNSLFYGGATISYGENFAAFAEAVHTSKTAYVCSLTEISDVAELNYYADYYAEHMVIRKSTVSNLLLIKALWVLISFLIILLSLVDSYIYQKTLFIQLAYGYKNSVLIVRRLCGEAFGLALSFFVPILILHSFLNFHVVTASWWMSGIGVLALDGIILLYPFWNFNCRAALGRGQHAGGILTACYGMRIVLLIVSILLSAVAVRQIGVYMNCQSLNNIIQKYSGYAYAQEADFDGESVRGNEEQIMVLQNAASIPALDGTFREVFAANAQATELLGNIIPDISQVDKNKIIIFFPDNMGLEDLEESGKEMLLACAMDFNSGAEIEYAYYPAGVQMPYLAIREETASCTVVNDDLTICYSENPIVIYYAGNFVDCYYYEVGFIPTDSTFTGHYTDYIDIYKSYQESIHMYRMQCLMWGSIAIIFLVLLHLLRVMILRLEHSLNAMELCLKKIYGTPLPMRYDRMSAGTLLSYVLGTLISLILLNEMGIVSWWSVFAVVLILFIGDMMLAVFEILRWENAHIMKILKGGCL